MIRNHVGLKAQDIMARDAAILASSYARPYPLVVERAQGSEVWDVDGRRFIDFMAGVCVLNVGHRHPHVAAALQRQAEQFWHICLHDFYYPQAVQLAEMMARTAPMAGPTRFYFGNTGTEAVEAAVKLAIHATGRHQFVAFLGGFHGRTLGALSFTASKAVQSGGYLPAVKVHHVPYPDPYRPLLAGRPGQDYGDVVIDYLEEELFRTKLDPEDIAAILVEPIQGEGGYLVPAPGFFPRLRRLCDAYGILLIVDEVQSGVGRTGRWWAIEHEGVEPDVVCFAKGIASGLPLGGIMAREAVMAWQPGAHGSTFGGNPLALAAAMATLEVIESEGLLVRSQVVGEEIQAALRALQRRFPYIGEVRGRGLMVGLEFVEDTHSRRRAGRLRDAVVAHSFRRGLLLLPCGPNSIRLTPPLNVPDGLVEEGLDVLAMAIEEAVAETAPAPVPAR